MIKYFYLTHKREPNRYYHSESVDLGVMAVNGYSTFPNAPDGLVFLPLCRDAISMFYSPNQLGSIYT